MFDDGVGAELALPGMRGLLRSVRVPEFAGTTFHEVEAKSALNRVPGGLAQSNIMGCALFSAISGSSTATALTIGTVALPEMRARAC